MARFNPWRWICGALALTDFFNCANHASVTWFTAAPWHIDTRWPGWLYGAFGIWFLVLAVRSRPLRAAEGGAS